MTYYRQDRNTADVRKKRDFGGFAMFCGTFNDAGRLADRQVKSGTVPQNAGHLASLSDASLRVLILKIYTVDLQHGTTGNMNHQSFDVVGLSWVYLPFLL